MKNLSLIHIWEMKRVTGGKGSTREAVAALAKMPLMYEPGTHWAYSHAHDVLAAVIELASGQKFSDYLRENIFAPLDADDFCFHPDAAMARRLGHLYAKDRLSGKVGDDDGIYSGSFSFTDIHESGGAGLITTVDAYSKVVDALSCGGEGYNGARILKPVSYTHLDVYKRQPVRIPIWTSWKRTSSTANGSWKKDVYKRQHRALVEILGAQILFLIIGVIFGIGDILMNVKQGETVHVRGKFHIFIGDDLSLIHISWRLPYYPLGFRPHPHRDRDGDEGEGKRHPRHRHRKQELCRKCHLSGSIWHHDDGAL